MVAKSTPALSSAMAVLWRIEWGCRFLSFNVGATRVAGQRTCAAGNARTPLEADIHAQAVKPARDNSLAFYDALIVAAAADAGCRALLTEDLQHGRKFGGVTIQHPFLEETLSR
jgi:predicted nucleic acid-binding protein